MKLTTSNFLAQTKWKYFNRILTAYNLITSSLKPIPNFMITFSFTNIDNKTIEVTTENMK